MKTMVENGTAYLGLTICLAALKLDGYEPWVDWSWIWICMPLWITFLVYAVAQIGLFLIAAKRKSPPHTK